MARGKRTAQETVDRVLAAGAADMTGRAISQATGLPPTTVSTLLQKHGPEVAVLRAIQTEHLTAQWQAVAIGALDVLTGGMYEGKPLAPRDAVSWATVAGIANDKVLILSGRPTSIVANLHEVRPRLPELIAKLAAVAARHRGVLEHPPQSALAGLPGAASSGGPTAGRP